MTSSVHDLSSDSDDDRNDEQKKAPEEQVQHPSPATGKSHADLGSPSVENVTPQYLEVGHMVQAAFPYPDPYYRSIFNPYGARPMMYPHLVGIKAGVPLPSDATEEPVFVNAKQYHGILRRRQSRAKAESENKVIKPRKPYVHESRHLHAMKRSRDGEGRFINAKTNKKQQTEIASGDNAETDNTTQDSSNHVS